MTIKFIKEKQGFTLIELTVVVVIIGIISAIVAPRFGDFLSKRRFRSTTNSIRGLIMHVRNRASLSKKVFFLNFELDENEYWVTYIDDEDEIEDKSITPKRKKLDDSVNIKDIVTQNDGARDEGEVKIRFLPTGYVDSTIIHLENINNKKNIFSLIIKPLSGKVKIEKGYTE